MPREDFRAWAARGFIRLLSRFSLRQVQRLGGLLGTLLYRLNTEMAWVTRQNLKHCLPDLNDEQRESLALDSLQEICRSYCEMGAVWEWPAHSTLSLVRLVDDQGLLKTLDDEKRPIVFLSPHIGNWELLGLYLASRYSIASMYSPPKIEDLDEYMRHVRERNGSALVPASTRGVVQLLSFLKKGGATGILPDQEPELSGGVFVPFFGVSANTMTLASRLIAKTGARAVVCGAFRLPTADGFRLVFQEAEEAIYSSDLSESVAGLNRSVEALIRQQPEQFQWAYKRFRYRPDGGPHFYHR